MFQEIFTNQQRVTRRQLFGSTAQGIGGIALASLLAEHPVAAAATSGNRGFLNCLILREKPKEWSVCGRGGGPSHVDLFDPKPMLTKLASQDIPESVRGTTRLSTMTANVKKWPITPAIKPFRRYGKCGTEMSEILPHIGALADEVCVVRSMHTEAVNHAPGVTFFMTGAQVPGRPSLGAWLSYGLGCAEDLPAFVAMTSSDKGRTCGKLFYDYYWGSGFLPSRFQGVRFRNVGDPVPYLHNPEGMSRAQRRALLDDIQEMNVAHLSDYGDPEIDARITQFEMSCYKMQASVLGLLDFSNEPKSAIEKYGPDALVKGTFANNCLIARRLLERGVRFVQLMHSGWDQHSTCSSICQRCRLVFPLFPPA
jgi:hypothetical protein